MSYQVPYPLTDLSLNAFIPTPPFNMASRMSTGLLQASSSSPGEWSSTTYYDQSPASSWGIQFSAYSQDDAEYSQSVMPLSEVDVPPSPSSDTCSSSSTDMLSASPPSAPQSVHVICNAPLVAPIPLPYHSPSFLQFELPDIEQDLSRPPYTRRISKRKRPSDEFPEESSVPKKLVVTSSSQQRVITETTSFRRYAPHVKRPRLHCHT